MIVVVVVVLVVAGTIIVFVRVVTACIQSDFRRPLETPVSADSGTDARYFRIFGFVLLGSRRKKNSRGRPLAVAYTRKLVLSLGDGEKR